MVIYNETFEAYRIKQKQIEKAIKILKENNYKISKNKNSNDIKTT